MVYILWCS